MNTSEDSYTSKIILGYDERGLGSGWYEFDPLYFIRWTRRKFSFKMLNPGAGKLMILASSEVADGAQKMKIYINKRYCASQRLLRGWTLYGIDLLSDERIMDVEVEVEMPFYRRWLCDRSEDVAIAVKAICVGDEKDIHEAIDEQRKFFSGHPGTNAMPVRLTVNNTDKCNLNCPTCPKQLDDRENMTLDDMPKELFEKIFSEASPYIRRLHLTTSGEPLLTKGLKNLLDRARQLSLGIDITTNGTLLKDPELIEKILKSVSLLVVSVDACAKETYEQIRVGAKFEQLISNLEMLKEMRRKIRTRPDFTVEFHYVLMLKNIEEFPEFIHFAKKLGADIVTTKHINVFRPQFEGESLINHKELANDRIREAKEIAEKIGIRLVTPALYDTGDQVSPQRTKETRKSSRTLFDTLKSFYDSATASVTKTLKQIESRFLRPEGNATRVEWNSISPFVHAPGKMVFCNFLWSQGIIEMNGDWIICCNMHTKAPRPGNVNHQSVREIWNGKIYRNLRKAFNSNTPPVFCRHCSFLQGEPTPDDEETYFKFSSPERE